VLIGTFDWIRIRGWNTNTFLEVTGSNLGMRQFCKPRYKKQPGLHK